ncbi:MAG: AsmA-like C-terminal region-containing protein [Chitinophagaceae bacterium]
MKKFLKITGITVLVILALLFLIPVLFSKQITSLVKKEINKTLTAKVEFGDVSLSVFRHFPKVSISMDNLSVVGSPAFPNDTLISAKSIDVSANLISVIKGDDIQVSGIFLESPRIHALVNKEGQPNWDIMKPSTDTSSSTDTSASAFRMTLKKYKISDGYIYYNDEASAMSAEIKGLNHEGSGDFTQDVFTLNTTTSSDGVNFTYAAIPYLVNTRTDIGADIEIDNRTGKYSFKTDDISLNNLKLSANGFFQLVNDSTYNMDISFKTPSNDFKDILSMIPAIYKTDFDKIKTSGKAAFEGFVKGTYSPQQIPAYDVKLQVDNGSFQYPELPQPVKNINISLQASNPDGKFDNTNINLSKGHLEMGNEPFDFRFIFQKPESARYIDAAAKGKIDLAQVSRFIKLENGMKLAGLVNADITAKGNMLSANGGIDQQFIAGGFLDITNLLFQSNDFPQPIRNGNMKIQLNNTGGVADNTTVNISEGHVEVGADPVDFTLLLSKPMSDINFDGTARGRFTLDNVKQFVVLEPGTTLSGLLNANLAFAGNKRDIDRSEYDKIRISGTAAMTNMKYVAKDYPGGISIPVVNASFSPQTVTIDNFDGSYLNSRFSGSGFLNNLIGYAMKDEPLKGTLNVAVDKMNLNDWMGTEETTPAGTTPASTEPFLVPANLDLTLNAKAGQVTYDKVVYSNINGSVAIADETVRLQNVKTDALDGTILLNGSYSTKVHEKEPDISLTYDVKDISVQKAFNSFVTVQKLMPIGQFLDGKLSSSLAMHGNLLSNMMPDLTSLTGNGSILILQGVLRKFGPLEKLANTLQIDDLRTINIKDVKNYIEFANGKVLVKPFTIKVKDIEMEIGGVHGFDQSIDYAIGMKVPRKYLGTQGNNLVNGLVNQAANKGIPVKLSDMIDLNVKMKGTLTNPSIGTDLKQVAGDAVGDLKDQAKDFAQAKLDSAKVRAKDSLQVVKEKITNEVKDKLKDKIFGTDTSKGTSTDTTRVNSGKAIKNTLKDLLNKKKKPATN